MSALYIIGFNYLSDIYLSDIWLANIFFHSVDSHSALFLSLCSSFLFDIVELITFSFVSCSFYVCVLVTKLCPALCHPMDCSSPGFSVHGIPQARILKSRLPFLPPEDLPNPGTEPGSPTLQADSLLSEPAGKPVTNIWWGVVLSRGLLMASFVLKATSCPAQLQLLMRPDFRRKETHLLMHKQPQGQVSNLTHTSQSFWMPSS